MPPPRVAFYLFASFVTISFLTRDSFLFSIGQGGPSHHGSSYPDELIRKLEARVSFLEASLSELQEQFKQEKAKTETLRQQLAVASQSGSLNNNNHYEGPKTPRPKSQIVSAPQSPRVGQSLFHRPPDGFFGVDYPRMRPGKQPFLRLSTRFGIRTTSSNLTLQHQSGCLEVIMIPQIRFSGFAKKLTIAFLARTNRRCKKNSIFCRRTPWSWSLSSEKSPFFMVWRC